MLVLRTSIVIAVAVVSSWATQRFVAPNGSDAAAGTVAQPYATVQKAHNVAIAGDTIYLRGGEYRPTDSTVFTKNGNGTYFHVLAYPGDNSTPVINGDNLPANANGWSFQSTAKFWHVSGIRITRAKNNGIMVKNSSYITLENGETDYCGQSSGTYTNQSGRGILGQGCSYVTIRNWDSHHNADKGTDNSPPYDDADGFGILAAGPGCRFEGCRSWSNADDGWDFYYGSGNSVVLINCWAAYNGKDDAQGSISGTPGKSLGDGNGFKLGGQDPSNGSAHIVKQCCSWKNKQRGFDYNGNPGAIQILNSTAWSNPLRNFIFGTSGTSSSAMLRNNISFAGTNEKSSSVTSDHNSWDLPVTVSESDFVSVSEAQMLGIRKADKSLPDVNFLHLASGSDLIDVGTNVGISFNGKAPDLGCFETNGSATSLQYFLVKNQQNNLMQKSAKVYDISGRLLPGAVVSGDKVRSGSSGVMVTKQNSMVYKR